MEHQCTPQYSFIDALRKYLPVTTIIFMIGFVLAGCGKGTSDAYFVREQTDLNYIQKVAVLPFSNNTNDAYAANRLRGITSTQILAMGLFDVVNTSVVDSALQEMAVIQNAPLDTPVLRRLGQRLNVQAFVHGSVENIGRNLEGSFSYPEVSLSLQLIESESSMILWKSTAHRHGYSIWDRLFDLDPQDGFQLSLTLIRDMLSTIPK